MTDAGHILDRFYEAMERGDVDAVVACCTPDARIWHGFDRVANDLEGAAEDWAGFIAAFPERGITAIHRQATDEGCVQQCIMVGRTADGVQRAWPVCLVVRIKDGLIARLDEYIDRAGSFTPQGELTATCDIPRP